MRSRLTRQAWIEAGLDALDRAGVEATSVERLARRLNVTRGSFYHHFRHRAEFVDALMQHWEHDYTTAVLTAVGDGGTPRERLQRYLAVAAHLRPEREVAIRAWALREPRVMTVLVRVDAVRLGFCRDFARSLWDEDGRDGDAELLAQLAHLSFIGLQHSGRAAPPVLERLYTAMFELAARIGR